MEGRTFGRSINKTLICFLFIINHSLDIQLETQTGLVITGTTESPELPSNIQHNNSAVLWSFFTSQIGKPDLLWSTDTANSREQRAERSNIFYEVMPGISDSCGQGWDGTKTTRLTLNGRNLH